MHILQDFIKAIPGVTEEFTDLESGETFAQLLQTGDGQQMVVAVRWGAGTGQGPDEEEPIIDDVEGFGFVAEVMFAAWQGGFLVFFGGIGIGSARLVGAGVIHIGSLRVAPGGKAAVREAGRCIASATFPPGQARRADPLRGRLRTGGYLMTALHARTRRDQLAVGGKGNTLIKRVARKGALSGNELIGHQALYQTVLTGSQPIQLSLSESHPQC